MREKISEGTVSGAEGAVAGGYWSSLAVRRLALIGDGRTLGVLAGYVR